MKLRPSVTNGHFGVGCVEERLDHITITVQPFDEAVRDIINISKLGFARLNWVDAKLPLNVVMRDAYGREIPWECGELSFLVHSGKVTVVIEDGIGNDVQFELGMADGLWPELCDSPEACHV